MFSRFLKRWEISASTGSHFDMLDGLRGVAILLVVIHHTFYVNPAAGWLSQMAGYVITSGWMGVPIFFVLSGFLISYPFFKGRETDSRFWYQRGYALRRIGKILPPFYLSIIIFIPFFWWWFHDPVYFDSAWKWATGLGSFISISPDFNGVYWSLMVESHFYIFLPLLFWLTRGLSTPRTAIILFFILFLVPLIARLLVWPSGVLVLPDSATPLFVTTWLRLMRFPCQFDYFAWGVIFAGIFVPLQRHASLEKLRPLSVLGYAGAGLMVVTLVYCGMWNTEFGAAPHVTRMSVEIDHLLPGVAALLLLFFIFDPHSLGARVLSLGWLRFTGIISFEWFLFHGPVIGWFHDHTGPTHGNLLAYAWRTVVPLILTFGFAMVVYRYFSLPILSRIREKVKPRQP